jgi:TfoX/Sxy family transcriptional regulator of competence genes
MPYNLQLEQRIRGFMSGLPDVTEKKMFGGMAFMLQGNLACGVHKDQLVVRVGPEKYSEALAQPDAFPFEMTGRPMAGWVVVSAAGYEDDLKLSNWVKQGVAFAQTLPPK